MRSEYSLPLDSRPQRDMATGWLMIAVGFLLASGIYPLLLALARTTYEMPWKDFFYTALVLHVDFTVLWWLLAIAGVFFALNASARAGKLNTLAMLLVVLGGIIAGVAPLTGDANPLTNNYVPMLENRIFIKGLILFGAGIFVLVLFGLVSFPGRAALAANGEGALRMGILTGAVAILLAIILLIVSFAAVPAEFTGRIYYETLFWAGGHTLQYAHTALLAVSWLWLANVAGVRFAVSAKSLLTLFALGAVPVLLAPVGMLQHPITDPAFTVWYVAFMREGNGVIPFLIGAVVLWGILNAGKPAPEHRHLWLALLFSMALFAVGGVLGLFIGESSTLITAHYHGSIVAVTMAFMAMVYYWLPQLGYGTPNLKWARIQVWAYFSGQLIHIVGLAWGGGHGMKRKVVGTTQDLGMAQHALSPQDLVGLGGVIAVLSGILFAVVVIPVLKRGRIVAESPKE